MELCEVIHNDYIFVCLQSPGGKRVKYTDTTYIVPASKIKKTATYQKTELTVSYALISIDSF